MGDERAIEALKTAVKTYSRRGKPGEGTERAENVAACALASLGEIAEFKHDESMRRFLLDLDVSGQSENLVREQLRALGRVGDSGDGRVSARLIMALRDSREPHTRAVAATALGKCSGPGSMEALAKAFRDDNPMVRQIAKDAYHAERE
jgi:HEAT repeat protein